LEFVRKINQDDFVIITNRLRSEFYLSFSKYSDPSVLESFSVRSQTGRVTATFFRSGTLLIRGDSKTDQYRRITQTVIDVLEHNI